MKNKERNIIMSHRVAGILSLALLLQAFPFSASPPPLVSPLSFYTSAYAAPAVTQTPAKVVQERFKALLAKNNHLVGWINVPNTKIDYPVVKTRNNDYYLHRDINRKKSTAAAIFMDYRNTGTMTDRHSVIYGHNMKNGSMFGTLKSYKSEDFYKANPVFTYSTLYESSQWEVFSVYVATATLDINETNFPDDAAFQKFLNARISKAMYGTNTTVSVNDKILTLVTCSYEVKNGRLIVHAKKISK